MNSLENTIKELLVQAESNSTEFKEHRILWQKNINLLQKFLKQITFEELGEEFVDRLFLEGLKTRNNHTLRIRDKI